MENFKLEYHGKKISVEEITVGKNTVFKVNFSENKPFIIISRAKDADGDWFWTSIPEGKLKLAEEIGKLVEDYFRKNK